MDRSKLSATVLELLEKETGETYPHLDESTTLREGLNLDSLDMAGLVLHIESHFGIQIETELLDDVKCPVIAIHGRRDRLVPASLAWSATEAHPSWWVRILPDVGHIPQMEAPERWMAAVEEWLASLG